MSEDVSFKCARIAAVAVEGTTYFYDKLYSYMLPPEMGGAEGCRVLVSFGKGNRKRQGIIMKISDSADFDKIKPITRLLDKTPLISGEMLELAYYLKEHTFCTYFEALKLAFPAGINLRIVASYHLAEGIDLTRIDSLSGDEKTAATYLYNSGATVEKERLLQVLELPEDSTLPDDLAGKGIFVRTDDAVRRVGDATVKMVRALREPEEGEKLSPKQKSVLDLLLEVGTASVKEICYFTGVTQSVVNALVKKGLAEDYENEVYRNPHRGVKGEENKEIILTESQQKAFETLEQKYLSGGGAALLYGVTGSGKTSVFLKMADKVAAEGRGVIVMVPEISLTPQTLEIFHRRYGSRVAVFHSAMSLGQRMDEWKRVKNGDALIAVGTRSAVFAPFENLGLIIMDEEQEHTYKSESSPRFHARDVARFRAAKSGALLILASATPSIESFSAAMSGRYTLCRLDKRYGDACLPNVETVDMRDELIRGNTAAVSGLLETRIRETLDKKQQAILLLNRRGHNTFVSCRSCGHVITCPNCSISMTYHSANRRLMCHYCGYSIEFTSVCPECGQEHMRYSGLGTQKAEEELQLKFPGARVLRMDADSTMTRNSYDEKLTAFSRGEYDIMLGTQMVAKGLDFPAVTLVGVLNADRSMYSDDYRSFERTFSLLTQVVGRSGRGTQPGTAVIQTINPESSVILLAKDQDYDSFYKQELAARKLMIYPPYCDICQLGFASEEKQAASDAADTMFRLLKALSGEESRVRMIILGPSAASVPKVSGRYRYRLIIKCRNNADFRNLLSRALLSFSKTPEGKKATVFADINPEGII